MGESPGASASPFPPGGEWLAEFPPRRRHMVVTAVAVGLLYLVAVTNQWQPTPDSALYRGLARNLLRGQGYRFNGELHTAVTPGLPLLLAGLHGALGDGVWVANLFVACCGLASLWVMYLALARLASRRMALAVVLATALCHAYFDYCHLVLTDAPFALVFWVLVWASARYLSGGGWWLALACLLAFLGVLIRAPGLTVLGPLAVALAADPTPPGRPARRWIAAAAILASAAAAAAGCYALARGVSDRQPLYVAAHLANPHHGLWFRAAGLIEGFARLPRALAQVCIGQSGTAAALIGLALLGPVVVSGVRLWRSGRRFVPVLLMLVVATLSFGVNPSTIRARYFMPVHPLLILMLFDGLCWCVRQAGRLRARAPSPRAYLIAVSLAVGAVAAANSPRLARDAFYHTYLAHTGRLLKTVRGGEYDELRAAAGFIRDRFGPDAAIAARRDRASILHWFSDRTIRLFARGEEATADDAEAVYADLQADGPFDAVITDSAGAAKPYGARLAELLARTPGLEAVSFGKYVTVYLRAVPAGPTAGRPASGGAP